MKSEDLPKLPKHINIEIWPKLPDFRPEQETANPRLVAYVTYIQPDGERMSHAISISSADECELEDSIAATPDEHLVEVVALVVRKLAPLFHVEK